MKFTKKRMRLLLIIVVVAIIGLVIARRQGLIGKEDGTKVTVEAASRNSIIETVSANGKIQPEAEVKISPDVSGEVVELYIKEGDRVKAGDLLAKIDPKIYTSNYERMLAGLNTQKANLSNALARVSQVEAQFINAQSTFKRNEQLWNEKAISASEFDAATSSFEVAKAEVTAARQSAKAAEYGVASAEASVTEARENLYKTSIYAPVDGTISKLNVEKGERVAGASQFSSGTEILRIANLEIMEVIVSVNENDIVRVSLSDTALVEVDSYLNRKFKGVVTRIATSANVAGLGADQVTNYDVRIRMLPDSYKDISTDSLSPFRPGMSATVDIQTTFADKVLTVPIQSVTSRSDTTNTAVKPQPGAPENAQGVENESTAGVSSSAAPQEYVFVVEEGVAKLRKVKTGIQDNTNIQILEGLKEGEKVISGPYRAIARSLKEGSKVQVVEKDKLFE